VSHHYSGPDFGFPHGDARLVFADLYAFPKPGDAGKSILIMNVYPDILSYDPRLPVRFPHNGRTLTDDVVDVFLSTLTNGKVTGDKVEPHGDLLDESWYIGPPHDLMS